MRKWYANLLIIIMMLTILISAMSMTAFAEETDEDVEVLAVGDLNCSHVFSIQRIGAYEYYDTETHKVWDITKYQCINCIYSYTVRHGTYGYESHVDTILGGFYTHFEKNGIKYHDVWNDCTCSRCKGTYTKGIATEICNCVS